MENLYLGRYRAFRSLGRGSQAEVFLASPINNSNAFVVIKVFHPSRMQNPRFRQSLFHEVQSLNRLQHPYIVQMLESGLDDPSAPCLVMEYVPGVTLHQCLLEYGRLTLNETAWIVGCICHALNSAHSLGIIHRDLKPANVMRIQPNTPYESLRIMDFGLAQIHDRPHFSLEKLRGSPLHFAMGTPAYISPEQLRGDPAEARSDLYSLGVMLYEMLTGFHPFPYPDTQKLLDAHLREKPHPFSALRIHDIPAEVEEVVFRCLAKYPADRPHSARDLALQFSQAIGCDIWLGTNPDQDSLPIAEEDSIPTPQPQSSTPSLPMVPSVHHLPSDPNSAIYYLDAFLPEAIAVMKIRGFLTETGGTLLTSVPGLIRMRIGEIPKRGILSMFGFSPAMPDPVEIDLLMEKSEQGGNRLRLTVVFHPPEGYRLRDVSEWRGRCAGLFRDLSAYLMAAGRA